MPPSCVQCPDSSRGPAFLPITTEPFGVDALASPTCIAVVVKGMNSPLTQRAPKRVVPEFGKSYQPSNVEPSAEMLFGLAFRVPAGTGSSRLPFSGVQTNGRILLPSPGSGPLVSTDTPPATARPYSAIP